MLVSIKMGSEEAPVRMQQRKKIVVIIANPLKTAIPHGESAFAKT